MIEFLSLVLYDYCKLHGFEFISADDILATHDVTEEEEIWLRRYISAWDILTNKEDNSTPVYNRISEDIMSIEYNSKL